MTASEAARFLSHSDLKTTNTKTWADLGCGSGTFTLALADILSAESIIYAVDKNKSSLDQIPDLHNNISIIKVSGDFEKNIFPFQLDGILIANALHYVKDKPSLIQKLKAHLRPKGNFLIIEYEMVDPNQWVPYPITFAALTELFVASGFFSLQKIYERPSSYNRAMMYSAIAHL